MAEPRQPDSGVTLIETLAVLALIGVSAGLVTYALPSGPGARTLAQEAALLERRLSLAAERSLTGRQPLSMSWQGGTYAFREWDGTAWQAPAAAFAGPHGLPEGMQLASTSPGGELRITPDLLPPATGPVTFRLGTGPGARHILFDGATARAVEGSDAVWTQ